jgi:Mg-chelatase subunit ChlD
MGALSGAGRIVQRLKQTASQAAHPLPIHGRNVVSAYGELASIIRDRLSRKHANLLAAPEIGAAGDILWSTPLEGAAVHEDALTPEAREALHREAQRLQQDIRQLSTSLHAEGRTATQIVAQMLEHATRTPPGHWLYSVGGDPVMVMWGHSDTPPALPSIASAASSGAVRNAGAPGNLTPPTHGQAIAASSAAGEDRRKKRALPLVLLSLVLLALLAAGALYWFRPAPPLEEAAIEPKAPEKHPEPPTEPIVKAPEPEPKPPPPEVAEKRAEQPPERLAEKSVDTPAEPPPAKTDPLDAVRQRIEAVGTDCAALKGLLSGEPLLRRRDPQNAELKNQVVARLAKHCSESLIAEAKNMCPGERPPELAPELVIVFDASGSMKFSLLATEQEIQQAAITEAMLSTLRAFGAQMPGQNVERLLREPTRITAAKQATVAIAKKIPRDANVGLVLIEECPSARRVGFFPPGQHGALLSHLQAIEPKGGTPLADAVAKAGQMVDGVKREAVILVVSDGQESCMREDPCAIGNALARMKPHLKINVVDITGTGAGNCLARATNGKVFAAYNAEQISLVTGQAAADALTAAHCAKR